MKYTILTFLLLLCLGSQAQKIRFTDTRNHWVISGGYAFDPSPIGFYLYYNGDSVIDGIFYKRLMLNTSYYFVREDTTSGMVYCRTTPLGYNWGDTEEHVLFNYNLHPGDTVFNSFGERNSKDSLVYLDSTLIQGVYHKVFGFRRSRMSWTTDTSGFYSIIEGVGFCNYPYYPFTDCFEGWQKLICFSQHAIYVPDTDFIAINTPYLLCSFFDTMNTTSGCASLGVSDIIKSIPSISIYPNPASTILNVDMKNVSGESGQIFIYDIQGRCVYHDVGPRLQDQTIINTSKWLSGIYLLIIQNETGILKEEKIMIER